MRDSSYYADKARYWLFSDRIPVTKSIIVTGILTFLLTLFGAELLASLLVYTSGRLVLMPWTAFTYPLVGPLEPISVLFSSYWMWVAGGSLERAWGSRTFGVFFFAIAGLTALALYAASVVFGVQTGAVGLWLPLAAVTVAFGMMNPEQQILFFFIIPMKLKYLAMLSAAMVLISFARPNPLVGVFALAGCAASYWYVRNGRSLDWGTPRQPRHNNVMRVYDRRGPLNRLNPFRAYKDWRERKRLRDFFDKSGFDD